MDRKLKKYNEQNAYLGFMVEDLRGRQEQIQSLIKNRLQMLPPKKQSKVPKPNTHMHSSSS